MTPSDCIAYFITFGCYGCWLHGDDRGSVDRTHNRFEDIFVEASRSLWRRETEAMTQPPYRMDAARRDAALEGMLAVAERRSWAVLALHVRSNHVHAVVRASQPIERVMNDLKTSGSRALNRLFPDEADRKRWARHGSTRYLLIEDAVAATVDCVLHRQGAMMAVFPLPGA
ncbi:MAG: transposase, partial [Gemmataceae bacterium]